MKVIIYNTFKVSSKLPLVQIASHFNIKLEGWKEYIKIESNILEKILKYESNSKSVYIYRYGCITFVNFKQYEIQFFLEYLSKIYIELESKLISKFSETHIMTVDNGFVDIWEGSEKIYPYSEILVDIAATVLAKSTELSKIEAELNYVLDESENLINYLNIGRLRANSKKVISIIAQCTRFKYRTIESVRLLDRPPEFDKSIETRKIFSEISDIYELDDRYLDVLNRTDVLDSITEEYFSFKHNQSERRLLIFEIMLLAIFPLMHFIG